MLQVLVKSRLAAHNHLAEEDLLQVQLFPSRLTHLHYRRACKRTAIEYDTLKAAAA